MNENYGIMKILAFGSTIFFTGFGGYKLYKKYL
jgi:hypothetical protein